jgi:hypothetical protein
MIEREALRALVRDVIREALAETRRTGAPAAEPVRIASDADLDAFVRRIAGLLREPETAARIEAGAIRFTLAAGPAAAAPATPAATAQSGLVNERAIDQLAEGTTLRLDRGAVVTPLARDRARQRRIRIERAR